MARAYYRLLSREGSGIRKGACFSSIVVRGAETRAHYIKFAGVVRSKWICLDIYLHSVRQKGGFHGTHGTMATSATAIQQFNVIVYTLEGTISQVVLHT